jgi:hypothetical protein
MGFGAAGGTLEAEFGAEGEKVSANLLETWQFENPHVGRERPARL